MSEDDTAPWESDQTYLKVTLKGGSGFEDSWVNIGAAKPGDLRRALVQFFGWNAEGVAELTLAQLAFNATQEWHAINNVGREMEGTRAIGGGNRRGRGAASRAYAAAQEEQEQAAPPDPKTVLLAEIEQQAGVLELKTLFAKNKEAFEADGDLLAAYKAKGRSLSK